MARPSDFTQEKANAICELLMEGRSLRSICAQDDMPSQTTVFRWLNAQPQFREQYAHARDNQADTYADRAVDEALTAEDASIGRLRMDALKWAAGKLAPKRYGDKLDLSHSGQIQITKVVRELVDPNDPHG